MQQKYACSQNEIVSPESVITHQASDTGAIPLSSMRTPPGAATEKEMGSFAPCRVCPYLQKTV